MKVLIINLDKAIFEPSSKSLERLKEYASFCEKLSVVVLTRKVFEPIISGNLSVYATGSYRRFKYSMDALRLAKQIITGCGADLVMTQDPFDTGHIGWLIKRKFKIPWQCQIHTDFLSPYFWQGSFLNKIRVLLAKFLLPSADGVRVVSSRIKRSIMSKCRNVEMSKITILPIFVDLDKFKISPTRISLRQKYPQFNFIILMASRFSREKNIGLAIEAMVEVVKKHPKTGLIIVGSGPEESHLRLEIRNWKLYDNVVLEPWSNDLSAYYKTADLFLLTSNYEGWGMTIIEAMASDCPVIMTDVGCTGELVVDGENGLVVPVNDQTALIGAINNLIESPLLREKFKAAGLMAVNKLLSKEQYLQEYKKSWESIIKTTNKE